MPLTTLILLPTSQPSPLPAILSHITLTFPCHSLPPFSLTHHLFASTSSLLPNNSPWPPPEYNRHFFSVLTLSQPSKSPPKSKTTSSHLTTTYLTTTTPSPIPSSISPPGPVPAPKYPDFKKYKGMEGRSLAEKEATEEYEQAKSNYASQLSTSTASAIAALKYDSSTITIPTTSTAAWLEMMTSKLTPLWTLRGTERIEHGTSISLHDGAWIVRMGELRQSISKAGVSASTQRGILCEVTWTDSGSDSEGVSVGQTLKPEDKQTVRAFLETLLNGTDVKLDSAKWLFAYTAGFPDEEKGDEEEAKPTNANKFAATALYTELLRART